MTGQAEHEWRWRQLANGRWHVYRYRLARISACGCAHGEPEPAGEELDQEGRRRAARWSENPCASCFRHYKRFLVDRLKSRKK